MKDKRKEAAGKIMCPYCDFNENETYPTKSLYDNKVVEVMLNKYKELEVNPYGYNEDVYGAINGLDFEIKYCPMCGRKLDVEEENER